MVCKYGQRVNMNMNVKPCASSLMLPERIWILASMVLVDGLERRFVRAKGRVALQEVAVSHRVLPNITGKRPFILTR